MKHNFASEPEAIGLFEGTETQKHKQCARCHKYKLLNKFIASKKMKFGAGSYCKKCSTIIDKTCRNKIKALIKDIPPNKKCSVCKKVKSAEFFSKSSSKTLGLTSDCKECRNAKKKIYRETQKQKFNDFGVVVKTKTCCVCKKEKLSNAFHIKPTEADFLRAECKKCSAILFAENRKSINFKIAMNLRERLRQALKGKTKSEKTLKYLGCSVEFLKQHLELKFESGMTWENYGQTGWHIDHIKPISLFNLSEEEEIKKACHYTNLQPLWAKENMSKGNKYSE